MTTAPAMQLGPDHKYCPGCGHVLAATTAFCNRCGAPQASGAPGGTPKSKLAAALLAFFAGGFGVHRFYLGQWGWGLLMLLTFWTFVPSVVALVDFIRYLVMSEGEFQRRYAANGGGWVWALVAGGAVLAFIFVLGILAAIAIPNFVKYQVRARAVELRGPVTAQLAGLLEAEEAYRRSTGSYFEVDGFPEGEVGSVPIPLSEEEAAAAAELGWSVASPSFAQYAVAVGADPAGNLAISMCAWTDLDGDGSYAGFALFRPGMGSDGAPFAPPPAPCPEAVVVDEGKDVEYYDGVKVGEVVPLSPAHVL